MPSSALKLVTAVVYRTEPQEATLWWDSDSVREVRKYCMIPKGLRIETERLIDFDKTKNTWTKSLGQRVDYVETKREAKKAWAHMIESIMVSDLSIDECNSNWQREWYYPAKA